MIYNVTSDKVIVTLQHLCKTIVLPLKDELLPVLKGHQTSYDLSESLEEAISKEQTVETLLSSHLSEFETIGKYGIIRKKVNTDSYELFLENTSVSIPERLSEMISNSLAKDISIEPIENFLLRMLANHNITYDKMMRLDNYLSQTILDKFAYEALISTGMSPSKATLLATVPQTPITKNGCLVNSKVSREVINKYNQDTGEAESRYMKDEDGNIIFPEYAEDRLFYPAIMGTSGDKFLCGDVLGHVYKVGVNHQLLSWDMVNCNDNEFCVKGLHTGNKDYIKGYESFGTVTHDVLIAPEEIGAISGCVIRSRALFIYGTRVGNTRGIYHTSIALPFDADAYLEKAKVGIKRISESYENYKLEKLDSCEEDENKD